MRGRDPDDGERVAEDGEVVVLRVAEKLVELLAQPDMGRRASAFRLGQDATQMDSPLGDPMARKTRTPAAPRTAPPTGAVAAAAAALAAGRPGEALAALLPAWRTCRDPALGDAIGELGARLPADAPVGRTRKDALAAWVAGAADPHARTTWLATLLDGNSKEALARLEALAGVEPDPRVGRVLAAAFADPPFQAASTKPFWTLAARLAVTHGDPAVAAALAALPGTLQARLGGVQMGEVLERLAGDAAAALAAAGHAPVDEGERRALDAALAAGRPDPRAAWAADVDAVDWTALEDAYGPADGIGAMLHDLAADDPEVRRRALDRAFGNIFHQGSVYSASVPAAALLARLLALPGPADRAGLLHLLVHLATNDPRERCLGEPPPWTRATKAERADPEVGPFVATWEAVLAAAPTARALLDDPDPEVRLRAAFLLGFLTPEATESQRLLRRRAEVEADASVLAALRIAEALLTRASGRTQRPPPPLGDAPVDAVIAALCQGASADAVTLAGLRDAGSRATNRPAATFPWFEGDLRTWARRLEQSLGLRPTTELLAELEATPPSERKAWSDRRWFLLHRLFGPSHAGGPKRLPAELDADQRRLVDHLVAAAGTEYHDWPNLDGWRMFRTTPTMRRWWGVDPAGPLDHVVDGVPLWKHLSDRVYGHAPPAVLAAVLPQVPVEVRLGALDEVTDAKGFSPYELEIPGPHADEPAAYELALEQRHNDRLVELLAGLAGSCGAAGVARAEALLAAQQALVDRGGHASGVRCALGLTVLARAAAAAGAVLDPRWDELVRQPLTTPPVQRTPQRTRELLAHLPADRAEAVLDDAVEVARYARTTWTHDGVTREWRTIRCDWGALDLFRLMPAPSARHAEKVVEAVVQWHAIRDATPRGEQKPAPLPLDAIVDFLRWAGDAATPAIDAARGGRADAVWARLG